VYFFTSPLYYEKVLKKKYPYKKTTESIDTSLSQQSADTIQKPIITDSIKEKDIQKSTYTEITKPDTVDSLSGDSVVAQLDTVWVETDKIICGIAERGGRIVSVRTKEFIYSNNGPDKNRDSIEIESDSEFIELVPQNGNGTANLKIDNRDYDNVAFSYRGDTTAVAVTGEDTVVVEFSAETENGRRIEKRYAFTSQSYILEFSVYGEGLGGKNLTVGCEAGITESEKTTNSRSAQYDRRKVHFYDRKNVEHYTNKKEESEERTGFYKWIGVTSKYFFSAIIAEKARDADIRIVSFKEQDTIEGKGKVVEDINYGYELQRTAESNTEKYLLYIGPSKITELKKLDIKLQKVLFGGWKIFFRADIWFPILCEFVLNLLIFFHGFLKDYGLVIIVMTILTKVITYPMTRSSTRSMGRMKDVQPKINAIRQKYKLNPKKMNEEVMKLYKAEGINPFNPGCLPIFLQMPILISLFIVLRKAIELRGARTVLIPWIHDLSQPEALPVISEWFASFCESIGLENGLPMYGNNVALLPIIMAVVTYFQNKMTMKDPNQKFMIYFMPIFLLFLFNNFPSGVVLYWTLSSLFGVVQQKFTTTGAKEGTENSQNSNIKQRPQKKKQKR
jgi:YidC/Oxa1 family membrane protein insertase